jgi:ketosteroid isomerase-like protein
MELGPLKLSAPATGAVAGEVLVKGKLDPALVQAWLATPEAYRAAGLTPQPALQSVKITAKAATTVTPGDVVLQFQGIPPTLQEYDLLLIVSDRKSVVLGEYRVDTRSGAREFAAAPVGTQMSGRRGGTALAAAPPSVASSTTPSAGQASATATSASAPAAASPSPDAAVAAQAVKPSTTSASSGDAQARAQSAVAAWAQAWSRKDVDAYIAAYEPTYAGRAAGASREAWVRERTARIQSRRSIDVQLSDMRTAAEGDTVVATFLQTYRGDDTVIRSRKRLVLAPNPDGRWLIRSESEGS